MRARRRQRQRERRTRSRRPRAQASPLARQRPERHLPQGRQTRRQERARLQKIDQEIAEAEAKLIEVHSEQSKFAQQEAQGLEETSETKPTAALRRSDSAMLEHLIRAVTDLQAAEHRAVDEGFAVVKALKGLQIKCKWFKRLLCKLSSTLAQ